MTSSSPASRALPDSWLAAEDIQLWPEGVPDAAAFQAQEPPADWPAAFLRNIATPSIRVYRPRHPNGAAVLVIPGGAYFMVSVVNEGADIAEQLAALGYVAAALIYRLPGEGWSRRHEVSLEDARRAIQLIRSGALGTNPDQVAAVGFSAGGHLAANLAAHPGEMRADQVNACDPHPAAVGLIYPVISMMSEATHVVSRRLLLGPDPSPALMLENSPDRHLGPRSPPLFVVHALDDPAVAPENSLELASACRAAGAALEFHLFERGGHGFGLGDPRTLTGQWLGLFDRWLRDLFDLPPDPAQSPSWSTPREST
jgi:acetyl esterase/lipase